MQEKIRDPDIIDKIINRMKEIRKLCKVNQKDFAKAVGTSQGYVSEVENRISVPGLDYIVSFGLAYNINFNWLITGQGRQFRSKQDLLLEEEYKAALEHVMKLMVEIEKLTAELNRIKGHAVIGAFKKGYRLKGGGRDAPIDLVLPADPE